MGKQSKPPFARYLFLIGSIFTLFFTASVSAMPEMAPAQDLLKRMAEASRTTSFSGTFTYEHGGVLKTFKIFHAVRDGKEYERLVHMNGPQAEVVRQGNPLECRRAGDVLLRGAIIENSIGHGHIEDFYNFSIHGEDRVAGRTVIELHVIPKDRWRYGYVLSIDKESSLLLRAMLVSANRKQVLERFQYVDVEVGKEFTEAELQAADVRPMVADIDLLPCVGDGEESPDYHHWRANWLPEGFILIGLQEGEEGSSETLMFTDGLGFFTIFIESGEGLEMPQIQARRGATVAVMSRASKDARNYAVCVVGEIPAESATRVAQSVKALDSR